MKTKASGDRLPERKYAMQTPLIQNNNEARRFETVVDGHEARLDYQLRDGVLQIDYVYVPSQIGGRGIGGMLVQAAVEWAEQEGWSVTPVCGFARRYLERKSGS
jgi:predicted GNAT family acetyltransferase